MLTRLRHGMKSNIRVLGVVAAAMFGVSCGNSGSGDDQSAGGAGGTTGTENSGTQNSAGTASVEPGTDGAATDGNVCEGAADPGYAPPCSPADPALILDPEGTTLQTTLTPSPYGETEGKTAYRTLTTESGPQFPLHTCSLSDDLLPSEDRLATRVELATFIQLTDFQLADSQDPARAPHFRWGMPGMGGVAEAFRNQEMMSTHIIEAMVQRANTIARGPAMGAEFGSVVVTGDQADSKATIEMKNAILLLDGSDGTSQVVTNTSAPGSSVPNYQGIQDSWAFEHRNDAEIAGDEGALWKEYWHPDPGVDDNFKVNHNFPDYPGLLTAAATNFTPTGLKRDNGTGDYVPWFTVYGNHDGLVLGILPVDPKDVGNTDALDMFNSMATGSVTGLGAIQLVFMQTAGLICVLNPTAACIHETFETALSAGFVRSPFPKNEDRAIFLGQEFIDAHFETTTNQGHGFCGESKGVPCHGGIDNVLEGKLYYSFDLADNVLGIVLDTVNENGGGPGLGAMKGSEGSLDQEQWAWAKEQFCSAHAKANCPLACSAEQCGDENQLVVLFSHHTADTMTNCYPGDGPKRIDGATFTSALWDYPNVILWVNGHTHMNKATPRANPSGAGAGFWEVTTASHIDFPQQSRILEIVDNNPGEAGTLSIFGTVFDHAGPAVPPSKASYDDSTPLELASIARELGLNDPEIALTETHVTRNTGSAEDNNVELVVKKPF